MLDFEFKRVMDFEMLFAYIKFDPEILGSIELGDLWLDVWPGQKI